MSQADVDLRVSAMAQTPPPIMIQMKASEYQEWIREREDTKIWIERYKEFLYNAYGVDIWADHSQLRQMECMAYARRDRIKDLQEKLRAAEETLAVYRAAMEGCRKGYVLAMDALTRFPAPKEGDGR